jgi:hypothetical protein
MSSKHHAKSTKHASSAAQFLEKKHKAHKHKKYWPWIILAIVILFVAAVRIRLLQIPLERDEGEFAYVGQLMLQGIPPYLLAYAMKLPGIYAAYTLVMAIFGQTTNGIHLGLMLINSAAIFLLFLLTRRLFDDVAAIVAAASYAFLSLSPSVLGTAAHATQFIVPLALGGTLLLLKSLDSGKIIPLFFSGLLYGLAFIMKQHAIFFIAFAFVYFNLTTIKTRPIKWNFLVIGNIIFFIGSTLPFLLSCAILYNLGVFSNFWFWTFTYASEYASKLPLSVAINNLKIIVLEVINTGSWIIAGIGLSTVFWNQKAKLNWLFLWGFILFSFLTVCPGFYFRRHYFITLLPALAMLVGVATTASLQWLSDRKIAPIIQIIPVLVIIAVLLSPIWKWGDFFFNATPAQACRLMYGLNPFPESVEIAKYIKTHTTNDDRIVVIGSEPQIYFYSNRKAATGYIYMYDLMESNNYASKMQQDMIKEIETSHPKYAVSVINPASWSMKPNSDMTIIKWSDTYFKQNYTLAGLISSFENTYKAYWDEEARTNKPLSPLNLFVMERKSK